VKEVTRHAEIEGNTLREALQKIVAEYPDWEWDNPEDDEDVDRVQPSAIVGVSHEGITTRKQDRELLKERQRSGRK
jgi:hypothetical protein